MLLYRIVYAAVGTMGAESAMSQLISGGSQNFHNMMHKVYTTEIMYHYKVARLLLEIRLRWRHEDVNGIES